MSTNAVSCPYRLASLAPGGGGVGVIWISVASGRSLLVYQPQTGSGRRKRAGQLVVLLPRWNLDSVGNVDGGVSTADGHLSGI
jgi:hypothetical protein